MARSVTQAIQPWMTLPLDWSMALPDAARHAPRVCSENCTKEPSFCLYVRLAAPRTVQETGQASHTFNEAIDGGDRSQMLANEYAQAPSLLRSAQLTLVFGHPCSSHGQGPPSARSLKSRVIISRTRGFG